MTVSEKKGRISTYKTRYKVDLKGLDYTTKALKDGDPLPSGIGYYPHELVE